MRLNVQGNSATMVASVGRSDLLSSSRHPTTSTVIEPCNSTAERHGFGYQIDPHHLRIKSKGIISVCIANSIERRMEAYRLASDVYKQMGYLSPSSPDLLYGPHDALSNTVTFLAHRQCRPMGTVTVVFDGPKKLPADDVFCTPIARLRKEGKSLCELVRLASREEAVDGAPLMKHFCKLAFLVAYGLEGSTDILITVNPRHRIFYERIMLFTPLSGPMPCEKVNGAPAILMRLDIKKTMGAYREKFKHLPTLKNPLAFFLDRASELVQWIDHNRRPMCNESMRRFFPEA